MARTISGGATAAKNAQYGSEPICILGVAWGGGNEIKYAERTVSFASGRIASMSSLNEIIQVDSNASNSSISITLLDSDGSLKAILDSIDIHKNKATLYQWFDGLAESDAFVLFTGEINSPITWNESERTLDFTVISQIESFEVGFSPEEGQFADVSPSLIGKTWPLAFGEVIHVPATQSTEKLRGSTQTLIGIPDYTLPYKYWHLRERLDILREGFQYYKSAIYYLLQTLPLFAIGPEEPTSMGGEQAALLGTLSSTTISDELAIQCFFNYITATAQGLEDTYCYLILNEDPRKQSFEDINVFITKQGKKNDDIEAILSSEEELEIEVITQLQDAVKLSFEDLQTFIEDNLVFSGPLSDPSEASSIISFVSKAIDDAQKAIDEAIKNNELKDAVDAILKEYTSLLDAAKIVSQRTDEQLTSIAGRKDILHTDVENAEYVFQQIKTLLSKINKLYINKYKTEREIFKVNSTISQHNVIPRSTVVVTGGERFPQNTPVAVNINDMTYFGTFSGKLFTALSIVPRHSGVVVVTSSRQIDSFEVADPTIDLRGHFCLISVQTNPRSPDYDPENPYGYRIFQVTNQVGTRCTIQLVELTPTNSKKQPRLPLLERLPDYVWYALRTATEHTVEEKKRILEAAIPKYDQTELDRLRANLDKLKAAVTDTLDDDVVTGINDTIYKNIREFNDKVAKLTYKTEALEKVSQKISKEEFETLLRLQNLKYRLSDTDDDDFEIVPTDRYYYVTGYDVQHIIAASPVMLPAWFQFANQGQELEQNNTVISLPNGSRIRANLLPDSSLWYADIGSSVELLNSDSEKHICNILPSEIKNVYAYRSVNGIRQLVPVPSRYYTKNEADAYGSLTCTTITLRQRLQDYPNEGWESTLYVSMASSIGPNTVDIIEWIAENYTDLIVDSTSFNAVRSLLTNYPSSFALFDKKDALTLMREIAWQARCSVWVVNSTLYIRYLSVAPDSTATITQSHILPDSLQLQHSSTEDLVTKFVATWRPDYTDKDPNKIIFRHNITKYGTKEGTFNFYIYNIESLAEKSATFWMIRKANTWKIAVFKTPLLTLQVQSLDGITLDITPNHFATDAVLGVVQSASYSVSDNNIDFVVWLPIRAGEMVPYDFAFPSSVEIDRVYPTVSEITSGYAGGGGQNVPTNLAYTINPNVSLIDQLTLRPKDYGKPLLSDSYDTYPASVIANLSETDYITLVPEKYVMPKEGLSTETNTKPEYTSPQATAQLVSGPQVFVGRISEVVDAGAGIYKVKAANNKEYQVQQYSGGSALLVKHPVTVIADPLSSQLVINEKLPTPGNVIFQYKVVSEKDDYLVCNTYDPETDTVDSDIVNIAKPYALRRKPFDTKTIAYRDKSITYTYYPLPTEEEEEEEEEENPFRYREAETTVLVSNPGSDPYSAQVTEAQRIVPAYYVGDVISAYQAATGLTTEEEEPATIQWTDLNTGGKVWAHSPSNDPDDS